ncbi:hypothetical protein TcWFU_006626 [Taenia crassiceps]|uniref:Uncharacterized protein n=1 Tax=Taenia crassiceps TaxID=6207 RepID=A0ABR4QHQ5_9CEST
MAAAATGTVEAMKRLFESGGKSESGSFINNHDSLYNGMSRGSNGRTNSSKNATNQNSSASSLLPYSAASERSCTDQTQGQQSRNKPTPPKVKPKPHVLRKTAPATHPELSENYKSLSDHGKVESGSVTGSSIFGFKAANGTKANNDSSSRLLISSSEPGSKHPALAENDVSKKLNKERHESAAPLPLPNSSRNPSKKPPPVPKKPKSISSAYSVDAVRTQYKYDEELEEQFGLKIDQSAYDFTQHWVACQAERQAESALNKLKKGVREISGKTTLNGSPVNISRTSSVSSSSGLSTSHFTNSSIRSILKKGRPSLKLEIKKRLTFKDDHELITKYNYPSEECYDDLDSLDRYRSALGSDSDSSSTFDEPEEYDFVNVGAPNTSRSSGGRMNENRILFTGSSASTTSSSTLKDTPTHQQKHSGYSSRNHNSSKNNDNAGASSGKRTTERNSSNKCSDAFRSTPIVVKPSKGGTFKRFSDGIRFHY